MSEAEAVEIPGLGTLEAFNTDGLRSLVDTVRADAMVERTLRYPGHLAAMRVLADAGLFATEPVQVRGQAVVPRDVAAALLFPAWQYEPGERDVTVLVVEVHGVTADGQPRHWSWLMVDRPDADSTLSSMARATGCPAAIVARWLYENGRVPPGVHPPERLGLDGHAGALLEALQSRGIRVQRQEFRRTGVQERR